MRSSTKMSVCLQPNQIGNIFLVSIVTSILLVNTILLFFCDSITELTEAFSLQSSYNTKSH